MFNYSFIPNSGNTNEPEIISLNNDAKKLIDDYTIRLKNRQSEIRSRAKYGSIKEILIKKYHVENIDSFEVQDFSNQTKFNFECVRGNVEKINGNIVNYLEGQQIVDEASTIEIP